MNFFSGILNGLAEVWSHKLRSLLTMTCVCLGVASMVVITGLISGLVASWNAWFIQYGGMEKISVVAEEQAEDQKRTLRSALTMEDAELIRHACSHATWISPETDIEQAHVSHAGKHFRVTVEGAGPEVLRVERYELRGGRFITGADNAGYGRVAVLGTAAIDTLYEKNEPVIGSIVQIKGQPFTVVGYLKKYELMQEGKNVLSQKNEIVFVPLTTMQKSLAGMKELNAVNVLVSDVAHVRRTATQITNALAQLHNGRRGYKVETAEGMKEGLVKSERSYFQVGGAVAAVSLLVGGIGIMNLMLASINERVREIGVRKAIGAWGWDIFVQFLAEAILLSLLGGVLGIAGGAAIIHVLQDKLADSSPPILSVSAVVVGFTISVLIGIVSGVYPAFKASRLDPIEALRYE